MRRGNGDGSIIKLSGKRRRPYAVRVTIGWTDTGKQKYQYLSYHEKITDAKTALREYLLQPEKLKLEKHTLKSIFEKMMEKATFSEGTKEQYNGAYKKLAALHNKNIAEIELEEIESIVEQQTPSGQARIKKTLANCYKYAMRYDYVNKNLADFITVDSLKPQKEKTPFTVAEINKLWKYLYTNRFDDIPLILLYSGMRISELLELKTENVDLKNKTINVIKSKTAAGIRVIPIHEKIYPLIKKRYNKNNSHLIMLDGKAMTYGQFNRTYWTIENHTIHETRHTFITYLSKLSSDKIAIKKLSGHAVEDITDHYTHRTLDELRTEINKLEYK
jgi:integrase